MADWRVRNGSCSAPHQEKVEKDVGDVTKRGG
jgi:hypothetical protein